MTLAPPSAAPARQALVRHRLDLTLRLRAGTRLVARFGAIGLLALVVDVGVFNLARHVLELGPLTSKTISVVIATTVAYLGNQQWTFGERNRRHAVVAALLFFAFNGVALTISLACLALTTYGLGLTSALAENLSTNVVGLALGTLFRFWAYHRWVFPTSSTGTATATGEEVVRDRDTRPWGTWQVLDEGRGFKVKRITVQPHSRLSYQTHEHRAEHWVVVGGRATCVVDDAVVVLAPGDSVDIEISHPHRIVNDGSDVLELIEVQLGDYTGEDDIVRIEDDYGRVRAAG